MGCLPSNYGSLSAREQEAARRAARGGDDPESGYFSGGCWVRSTRHEPQPSLGGLSRAQAEQLARENVISAQALQQGRVEYSGPSQGVSPATGQPEQRDSGFDVDALLDGLEDWARGFLATAAAPSASADDVMTTSTPAPAERTSPLPASDGLALAELGRPTPVLGLPVWVVAVGGLLLLRKTKLL